jgi:DNA-binding transcriptional LysR family regulator
MAEELAPRARALLDDLRAFSVAAGVDLARLATCVTIAANDLQRDLLLPGLLRRVRRAAPKVTLRVIPSGVPEAAMMRDDACQLVITPRPPEGDDVFQKRLFEDRYCVFYDPTERAAPASLDDWLAADHVTVVYHPRRALDVDDWLRAQGVRRHVVATVPGMSGLAAMLRGGNCVATAPSMLGPHALRGLAAVPVPVEIPRLPMYMVWHRRHHADPVQRWLRDELEAVAAGLQLA